MTHDPTRLVLEEWRLTPERVAVHVPTATGVVADLHLGYDEARAAGGDAVPIRRLEDILQPLTRLAPCNVRCLVVAGDLFERGVDADLLQRFQAFLAICGLEWTGWVPGNHDRGWEAFRDVAPLAPEGVPLGRWHVRHGDESMGAGPEVVGHWHPRVVHQSRRCPCYLVGAERLVLPAFSTDAAGVSLRGGAWSKLRVYPIVDGAVVSAELLSSRPVAL